MRASHNWLKTLSGVDATPEQVAERLTSGGLEVEAIERVGEGLDRVVVGEVRARRKVEGKDKLSLVTVFDGEAEVEVICGAPNVPEPGGRILFARVGAVLPGGFEIGEREIAGVVSRGMICSESELGIGEGAAGIFVLGADDEGAPGQRVADALGLVDAIFEIGLTPNRPDGLGHVGLARELALLSGARFEMPAVPAPHRIAKGWPGHVVSDGPSRFDLTDVWGEGAPLDVDLADRKKTALGADRVVDVTIAAPERCSRYGAALVFGVRVGPSPFWMRYRLHCLGIRAIHNVVDVTNYVLLEHGHPIHAFDLTRVRGRRIDVRLARDGETMATLDAVERRFTADDLLICDGEGPVAVAGVMGGGNSEIGMETRDVLIECAYFDPRSVRRTGRRLGLHTDASHRFERGVDPNAVPRVLARTAQLVGDVAGGAVEVEALDVHPRPIAPITVVLRPARVALMLGFETSGDQARELLEGLGCTVRESGKALAVTVPTHRPDIVREVDLIEEIARVRGYDHIPILVPHVRPSAEGTPRHIRFERALREAAAGAGLDEAITYAFLSPSELAAARVPTDCVPLVNPLSEERSVMRTSLLPGMAAAARHSQRRQVTRVSLFEVGRTYHPDPAADAVLPVERPTLGMFLLGPRDVWIGEGDHYDFYDGKGFVEAVLGRVTGRPGALVLDDALPRAAPWLHPRRCAAVELEGARVGTVGELHPDVVEALEIEGRPVYAEMDLTALLGVLDRIGVPQAQPLPRFPSVARDIAMLVDEGAAAGEIAGCLAEAGGGLVEDVCLFDLYRGAQVPAGKKSLAFRVIYRDPGDTLTDKRVDKAHARVAEAAKRAFSAIIR